MTTVITEVFWNAACGCGWKTEAPNDADTVCNKLFTHLKTEHDKPPFTSVMITSYTETRPIDTLPALGKLASKPAGVHISVAASTRAPGATRELPREAEPYTEVQAAREDAHEDARLT